MTKIVTYTPNPALDVNTEVKKVNTNEKLRCEEPRRDPGGGGVNVSRALKRLGQESIAVYTKGGPIGEIYRELLDKEGVHQNPLEIEEMMRENLVVRERENNDLYRFGMPGAELQEKEWRQLIDMIDDFKDVGYLVASGSLPPGVPDDFYNLLSAKARENDIRFILDTSKEPLRKILDEGAYLIKPNKKELGQLVNEEISDENQLKEAIENLVKSYPLEVVVVSLGSEGAIFATKDEVKKLPAASVQKKSSVGAGDSMVAGIVYSLARDADIFNAIQYGLACGSAALKTSGTELLHKEDVKELMEEVYT